MEAQGQLGSKETKNQVEFHRIPGPMQVMTPTAKTTHTALVGSTDFTFRRPVLL